MSTALAKSGGGFIVQPQNLGELESLCRTLANSDLVPKDYKGKAGNCFVAIQFGAELGLSPLQALQNIACINGRGAIWGDAMLALCMNHPDYVDTVETYDEATKTACCVAKRKGRADKVELFSWADAELAKLTSKDTYKQYPKRMLKMRARGFALRDQWTDVLKGLISAEEVQDYPQDVRATVVSSETVTNGEGSLSGQIVESKPKQEAPKQEHKQTSPVGPVFWLGWPDANWKGKLLSDAPSNILHDYGQFLENLLKDEARKRTHDGARKHLEAVTTEIDRRMAAEADKALAIADAKREAAAKQAAADRIEADSDEIAEGLQAAHDAAHGNAPDEEGSYLSP